MIKHYHLEKALILNMLCMNCKYVKNDHIGMACLFAPTTFEAFEYEAIRDMVYQKARYQIGEGMQTRSIIRSIRFRKYMPERDRVSAVVKYFNATNSKVETVTWDWTLKEVEGFHAIRLRYQS